MPGLNGFEVLRAHDQTKPQVIFVTAFDQYAVKAFEVNAIDYLLKPIDEARLQQAIGKLHDTGRVVAESTKDPPVHSEHGTPEEQSASHSAARGRRIVLMNPADIHYLRSEQGVTIVVTQSGEYWASYPLAEMEEFRSKIFFRTHRSTIINLNRIKEIVPAQSGVTMSI
jgi:two-component system LytT family response regulator